MSINLSARLHGGALLLLAALFVTFNTSVVFARPPGSSTTGRVGSTSAQQGGHRHGADDRDTRQAASPKHGGQVSTTATYAFEVV